MASKKDEARFIADSQRAWDNRSIITPPASDAYRDGWDRVFGKGAKKGKLMQNVDEALKALEAEEKAKKK